MFFIELLNIAVPYTGYIPVLLYPMWKTRDVKTRFIVIYLLCFMVFLVAALFTAKQFMTVDADNIQLIKLITAFPAYVFPFLVFRKRIWQNAFLLTVTLMASLVWVGTGMYVGEMRSAGGQLLTASIVSTGVIAVTLPPLLFLLRRLCGNPNMTRAVIFWRFAWLVPIAFFSIITVAGGQYVAGGDNSDFIVVRILVYAVLLFICYLFDVAVRQISKAEAAERAAEEFARKTEFYRKMSHDLRTPLTVVSTNIQTAKRRPDEAVELLTNSQAEIMKMAGMISDALKDGEKGAGE